MAAMRTAILCFALLFVQAQCGRIARDAQHPDLAEQWNQLVSTMTSNMQTMGQKIQEALGLQNIDTPDVLHSIQEVKDNITTRLEPIVNSINAEAEKLAPEAKAAMERLGNTIQESVTNLRSQAPEHVQELMTNVETEMNKMKTQMQQVHSSLEPDLKQSQESVNRVLTNLGQQLSQLAQGMQERVQAALREQGTKA